MTISKKHFLKRGSVAGPRIIAMLNQKTIQHWLFYQQQHLAKVIHILGTKQEHISWSNEGLVLLLCYFNYFFMGAHTHFQTL